LALQGLGCVAKPAERSGLVWSRPQVRSAFGQKGFTSKQGLNPLSGFLMATQMSDLLTI
jgi:hypothetical protein